MTSDTVVAHSWVETRRDPRWLEINTGWGSHRAVYPYLELGCLSAHLVGVPAGQRSPWHSRSGGREVLFLGVAGELEFAVPDGIYPLDPCDVLVSGSVPYSYQNLGVTPAFFWVLNERHEGAKEARASGRSSTYYDEAPSDPTLDRTMGASPWAAQRRLLEWPAGEAWGSLIGAYPPVGCRGITGRIRRLPAGQVADLGPLPAEALYFGLEGNLELVAGEAKVPLGLRDAAAVPAGVAAQLVAADQSDALLFELHPAQASTT